MAVTHERRRLGRAGIKKKVATAARPCIRAYSRIRRSHEFQLACRDRRDREHMRMLLAFSLSHDSNCIDIGAHRGNVLAEIVRLAPEGRHIAYEPLDYLCEPLVARFPQVDVRCAALSNQNGRAAFTHVRTDPAYSGFRQRDYPKTEVIEKLEVRTERLDDSLPAGYVPHLIKIDVEGAERQVLEGAIETITAHKPIVIFEHGQGSAEYYGTAPSDVFSLLSSIAGLRIFDIDGRGPLDLSEFERSFHIGSIWNFVAHA